VCEIWQPKRLSYNGIDMAKSGTALKALRRQRKPNKRAARRDSGEKAAQATLKERLAALYRLQRICQQRKVDFGKWRETIRKGRR
jgi:hypothetical protein